jgi:hypothetical protein
MADDVGGREEASEREDEERAEKKGAGWAACGEEASVCALVEVERADLVSGWVPSSSGLRLTMAMIV